MFSAQTYVIALAVAVGIVAVGVAARVVLSRLAVLRNLDNLAGFSYNPEQDIFSSDTDAWQRRFGYRKAYDNASPFFNMIIDSEPVKFRYAGKNWLIELWKGQYGMTTGAEIGVYYTRRRAGNRYKCVKNKDMLPMSIRLIKNGRERFSLRRRHWWLTGFILGEFSQPAELQAICGITFPEYEMRDAFVAALFALGYDGAGVIVSNLHVRIVFAKPKSPQPSTRTLRRERDAQAVNRALCEAWNASGAGTALEKLERARASNPELYRAATAFGGAHRRRSLPRVATHDL